MKRKGDGSQWQDNGDKTGQWSDSPFCGGRRFIRQGVGKWDGVSATLRERPRSLVPAHARMTASGEWPEQVFGL